jgi:hypothetical protein
MDRLTFCAGPGFTPLAPLSSAGLGCGVIWQSLIEMFFSKLNQ